MLNRRQLLLGTGALLAGSSAWSGLKADADEHGRIQLGAQTNAWAIDRTQFDSFLGVLEQIRRVGYAGFETGFANVSSQFADPRPARSRIETLGLTFFGVHIYLPSPQYDPSTHLPPASLYEKVAQGAAALGARHLIFSADPVNNKAELERKIEGLNAAGDFCRRAGVPLAYHNETTQESQSKIDGLGNELGELYRRTDPALVSFVLDCGHAWQGGTDVPAFVAAHHARIIGLHLRDYKDGRQVVLGQGAFPLQAVAKVLKQAGWKGWVLNEEERLDGSKHGLEYIEPALHATREAFS
jgi:inosose dehydratase